MTPDLSLLFDIPKVATAVACYLGLAEAVEKKLDKLCSEPLNSAIRSLRELQTSEAQTEHLLREAQSAFRSALSLESGSRLATAYIGLSFCQHHLADRANSRETLRELVAIPFRRRARSIANTIGKGLVFMSYPGLFIWLRSDDPVVKALDRTLYRITGLTDEDAAIELQNFARQHLQRQEPRVGAREQDT